MKTVDEERFLRWLTDNGATFPKLRWPAVTPNEELCWRDPQLRPVFEDNRDIFTRDDPILALFLVREMVLGDRSFFYPYLSILPYPESVQDWTEDEIHELHDGRLAEAAARRSAEIETYYHRVFTRLQEKYPGEFSETLYTFDKFKFAWKTIQARTFGRRLPWTALVPFADCLNHTNVATKYDFDVDGNGMFRLYPSGATSYVAGAEAFNSYGRRSNFQLLLDYGFALPDNEWDYVDIDISKSRADSRGNKKCRFMRRVIRIDWQSSLDELFPPNFLQALANSVPDKEQNTTTSKLSELNTLCDALKWLRDILSETVSRWGAVVEDERLLREDTSGRLHAAIVYRTGRKKIVKNIMAKIDKKLGVTAQHPGSSSQSLEGVADKLMALSIASKK
ncbi:hypothetical protein BBJ29_006436 [Phytophthora kernoviae]|uniref:SET domain-containing protein n=1 Tax=Phytophthora kernoviae TaxID=325452 RepID=A0A3F2RHI4_9STRA|nr:hypothetical protein BBP00_00007663 [Phytophthora kernoviae]RLN58280.1 hypothetical protein BBJ29_006436 [Phytophthora kernoviae]